MDKSYNMALAPIADTAGKCVPQEGSAYSSALDDLSEPVQRHVLDFRLCLRNNDAMQAEIRAVRDNLLDWSASHESWEIRMWCNIIARGLDALGRDPDNLPLRQQTGAKVKQLTMAAGRILKLKKPRSQSSQIFNEYAVGSLACQGSVANGR
jgi:hypothetical protein